MNKKTKKKIKISDLCCYLHSSYYSDITIENHTTLHPSPERIQQIAMIKLKQQQTEAAGEPAISADSPAPEKRIAMKKNTMRILILAAAVCLVSVTAFAAANGGLGYFTSIFGDSATTVQGAIQSPSLSNANKDYKLGIESLLSDGYKTNIIVSLESINDSRLTGKPSELFSVQVKNKSGGTTEVSSYKCKPMEEFKVRNRSFYRLEVSSLQSHLSSTIEIALNNQNTALKIDVPVEYSTAAKTVKLNAEDYSDKNYKPETVQLSPLGVMVIGRENQAKGGLPNIEIFAMMKDGTKEEMMSSQSFDTSENTVTAGGGVILDGGPQAPLATETMAERNQGGKIVSTGYFSRILDLNQVKSILVDGTEYPIG